VFLVVSAVDYSSVIVTTPGKWPFFSTMVYRLGAFGVYLLEAGMWIAE
jgi:hypothetical protein